MTPLFWALTPVCGSARWSKISGAPAPALGGGSVYESEEEAGMEGGKERSEMS